jgi:hypothetical protein
MHRTTIINVIGFAVVLAVACANMKVSGFSAGLGLIS